MSAMRSEVIFILGATASGKSDYAVDLAESLGCSIVSADAYQVYRGMDIGTAKPSHTMLQRVPHHLIDCVNLFQDFDVAQFISEACAKIDHAMAQGQSLVVTGGTNYYIHTLVEGLAQVPKGDPLVRLQWQAQLEEHEGSWLWEQLHAVDAQTAERLHPNDHKRVIRALEIHQLSGGRPLSSFKGEGGLRGRVPYRKIGLAWPKEELFIRIEQRVKQMLSEGLIEEVEQLIHKEFRNTIPMQTAVGYKETLAYLDGEILLDDLEQSISSNTKKLVKKQLTWLKRDSDIMWIDKRH